jgi:enoyl-CoA hydratase/carnithine racemase
LLAIERCSAVWIAALNGSAGGGGCELALACDKRFMADGDFQIGQPEVFLGFPPGGGGTQRLARLLGPAKALHVCLDGGPMSPNEANALGLVDRVVSPAQLLQAAAAEAARLGRRPKTAIGAIKRAIYEGGSLPISDGLRLEALEFISCISTEESKRAQQAYVEKLEQLGDVPIEDAEFVAEVLERGRVA